MSTEMFNWGIIAPGRIAKRFAEGLHVIDDARLYAVASSNAQRGQSFADSVGGAEKVYDNYQALAEDPAIDGIYIANPHRFHLETARMCLEAGKPVLCEKPLTVTARESEALIALAEEKQVFLMEALWTRFLPVWVQVKQWLDEGLIGEVKVVSSTFGFKIPRDQNDRLLNLDAAGGVLLDMGIYCVAMSQFVMGRDPEVILADGVVGKTGVDERSSAILNYGGPVSVFSSNFEAMTENDFSISGTKGMIQVSPFFWDNGNARLQTYDGVKKYRRSEFRGNGFEYQTEEAMRCIRKGKLQSDIIPWQDTLGNMRTMDTILSQIGVEYPFAAR